MIWMVRCGRLLLAGLLVLGVQSAGAQTLLLSESFDGEAQYTANLFSDSLNDYFTVSDGSGPLDPSGFDPYASITPQDGSAMLQAEDTNSPDNPLGSGENGYLIFDSQDVSAYDRVEVRLYLAADQGDFDDDDFLYLEYAFDDDSASAGSANVNTGTYTRLAAFIGPASLSGNLQEDTDLNGTQDGTVLSATWQQFSYIFDVTGTSASVRLQVHCDSTEEIAVDTVRIYGLSNSGRQQ